MKKKILEIGILTICATGGILAFNQNYKSISISKENISSKTIAMYKSEDGENYTQIDAFPSSGYTINEEKSYCTTDNKTKVTGKIKTINGKHVITNLKKLDKCYIWFDKQVTAGDTILSGIIVNETTPDFSQVATTNEGVFKVTDGMYKGYSYYWRGAVTNNYVKFANKCWRIVRINGDGSIRLIYDGSTCHANGTNTAESIAKTSIAYNSNYNQSNYVGWTYTGTSQRTLSGTASNAKTQLESWYSSNITGTNAEKVADGKYCNDRNVQSGNTWAINGNTFYYAAYKRIVTDKKPSLACNSGDVYTLKIGLITADEVMYAGESSNSNSSYYLYNGQYYWTMSPSAWTSRNNFAGVFYVDGDGGRLNGNGNLASADAGLRPVINLHSDVTISSGDGTQSNPFIIAD